MLAGAAVLVDPERLVRVDVELVGIMKCVKSVFKTLNSLEPHTSERIRSLEVIFMSIVSSARTTRDPV